jgi:hypothetical protein
VRTRSMAKVLGAQVFWQTAPAGCSIDSQMSAHAISVFKSTPEVTLDTRTIEPFVKTFARNGVSLASACLARGVTPRLQRHRHAPRSSSLQSQTADSKVSWRKSG